MKERRLPMQENDVPEVADSERPKTPLRIFPEHTQKAFDSFLKEFEPTQNRPDASLCLTTEDFAKVIYNEGEYRDYGLIVQELEARGYSRQLHVVDNKTVIFEWWFAPIH